MRPAAGWGRRRADEDAGVRGRVRIAADRRPGPELAEILEAAEDVAADEVRIVVLDLGRSPGRNRQDPVPGARGEALDLAQDRLGHVDPRAVRDVTVGPDGVLALRRARWIEQRGLRQEHERALRDAAAPNGVLARGDLLERAAEVDGAGAKDPVVAPGQGTVDGDIELEHARPRPVAAELGGVD